MNAQKIKLSSLSLSDLFGLERYLKNENLSPRYSIVQKEIAKRLNNISFKTNSK